MSIQQNRNNVQLRLWCDSQGDWKLVEIRDNTCKLWKKLLIVKYSQFWGYFLGS